MTSVRQLGVSFVTSDVQFVNYTKYLK